ncbi:MAG: hypothetical protein V3U54_02555 [Thermodesulfobacteriota bacterium]
MRSAAQKRKTAYNKALSKGLKTWDLGGDLGTVEFAEAIVKLM